MEFTQFLIIEITTGCNLGKEHGEKCPNIDPARWDLVDKSKALTDEKIMKVVHQMYDELGFQGAVAWHYYNEPMIAKDRMMRLMKQIKEEIPAARFALWTNGELVPAKCDFLQAFDFCWVTDYHSGNFKHIQRQIPHTKIMRWPLDDRKSAYGIKRRVACGRMYSEFILDHYGNCHICCIDWQAETQVGNVWTHDLVDMVARWKEIRTSISHGAMADDAPDLCLHCNNRHPAVANLVPDIAKLGRAHVKGNVQAAATRNARQSARGSQVDEPQKKPRKLFAVAAIESAAGSADAWLEHHAKLADDAYVVQTMQDATTKIKRSGAYFGAVMTTGQTLSGPVMEALAIHLDENILTVKALGPDGQARQSLHIGKLREVATWAGREPIIKKAVNTRSIVMNELSLDSRELPPTNRLAVTFTHFRIPDHRLQDHFRWNDELYRKHNARVFVVTDKLYDVPDYATCLVYPEPMPTFKLSMTSNYGIRYAIDSGFGIIIKTDTDIAFPEEAFERLAQVEPGSAGLPCYHMASNYPERESKFVLAPNATGTISMVAADWMKAHFHEMCVGYGCDDGILRKEIKRQGIEEDRASVVFHIAHVADTPQKEFNRAEPRTDHWNREDEFNPENFAGNRSLHRRPDKKKNWGLPGFSDLTVVVTHHRMPTRRLDEFIEWNGELFEKHGVRLIVVSDMERAGLPSWCRVAVYPIELLMFNLSKTSNYGIRLAGNGIICKSDPDCVFSEEVIEALKAVTARRGYCPKYYMAKSYEAREACRETWDASKGTLALHYDHWDSISGYDERCEGYGIEDGDCYQRARMVDGCKVERVQLPFWHIAHTTMNQTRGNTRKDAWGRKDGINPKNNAANARAIGSANWHNPAWGIPGIT